MRFKVDAANSGAHFTVEANDAAYQRFGVYADGGVLYAQTVNNGVYRYPTVLLNTLQINTWYVLRMVVDDSGRGFYVEVYKESDPTTRSSFSQWMPIGKSWRFHHWNYRGNAYLDDYQEFNTAGLSWNGDERLTYTYDHLDRLTAVATASGATGYAQSYEYNQIGNLTRKTDIGYLLYSPSGAGSVRPHAVTGLSTTPNGTPLTNYGWTYDGNGNMLTRKENNVTYTQTWDEENRVKTITGNGQTATYYYDGDGVRVKKVQNGVTTVYVNGFFEKNTTTGEATSYYYAGTTRVAVRSSTSGLKFLHADHLGSTTVTTDLSANVVGQQRYYAYGQPRNGTGTLHTDRRFTGQREETNLGSLYDYNARMYSPLIGRFVSADTIVPGAGNPQAFNRYAYANNSPMVYVDPSGHDACTGVAGTYEPDCGVDGWTGPHPVFFDPGVFGFVPGVNVDLLPYLFYTDPRQFEFTVSVEYANAIVGSVVAPLACGLIGQGCIPDIPGSSENYPVTSELYYGSEAENLWFRYVKTSMGYQPAFVSYWSVGEFDGEQVAIERFIFAGRLGDEIKEGTAYLRPVIGDPSKPVGQKDPLKWETVGYKPDPSLVVDVKVVFETRQTGLSSIQTVGRVFVNGGLQGTVTLNGTYKGR